VVEIILIVNLRVVYALYDVLLCDVFDISDVLRLCDLIEQSSAEDWFVYYIKNLTATVSSKLTTQDGFVERGSNPNQGVEAGEGLQR
jgi:hypothetical protein